MADLKTRQLAPVNPEENDEKMNAQAKAKGDPTAIAPAAENRSTAQPTRRASPEHGLDRWFDDQLNRLFNDVSSEPLPPDLARLVNELKAQGGPAKGGNGQS